MIDWWHNLPPLGQAVIVASLIVALTPQAFAMWHRWRQK